MFTGTLIEDLIATVERIQQGAEAEAFAISEIEPWIAAAENAVRESELTGVA